MAALVQRRGCAALTRGIRSVDLRCFLARTSCTGEALRDFDSHHCQPRHDYHPLLHGPTRYEKRGYGDLQSKGLISSFLLRRLSCPPAAAAAVERTCQIAGFLSHESISILPERRSAMFSDRYFSSGGASGGEGGGGGAGGSDDNSSGETIAVTFVNKDGSEEVVRVPEGKSMLEVAHENEIELEGACEGSLACSTCHVIVTDEEYYNKLPEPSDEENDMLDLAFGLTDTSRLGCQVIAKKDLDGIRLALPSATRNFAVDGHVPKPH